LPAVDTQPSGHPFFVFAPRSTIFRSALAWRRRQA
jgi:hypothetical protein